MYFFNSLKENLMPPLKPGSWLLLHPAAAIAHYLCFAAFDECLGTFLDGRISRRRA